MRKIVPIGTKIYYYDRENGRMDMCCYYKYSNIIFFI